MALVFLGEEKNGKVNHSFSCILTELGEYLIRTYES
jgi:hypothetical protein